jgi:8-oxo-dGTP pyrophosphatase MutT (NUDIX family)
MRQERSAGGVVFRGEGSEAEILLVLDRFGRWTFPKGRVEGGESDEEAALREIEQETGVQGQVIGSLPTVRYRYLVADDPEPEMVEKEVRYFLVRAEAGELRRLPGETRVVRWLGPREAERLLLYEGNRPVLEAARAMLEGRGRVERGEGSR